MTYKVDVKRIREKMGGEKISVASLARRLHISRGTLDAYFLNPNKIPYAVMSQMASILCDSHQEAINIFLPLNLRKKKVCWMIRLAKTKAAHSGRLGEVDKIEADYVQYRAGYIKALMDLRCWLAKAQPAIQADRKHNNVKNFIWLLDCIISDVDKFAAYADATPINFCDTGKKTDYYIPNEWPFRDD